MKTAAASVISASASAPPIWNSRRKTSEVLRKLSLNAAKNWVQNRGAKRRVISREEDMAFPLVPTRYGGARARAAPTGADGLRDDNLGKRTIARRGRAKRRHWCRGKRRSCTKQRRAARGRPPLRSCHVRFRYQRRRGRCPPRSIRMAATLRQTAAPHASVKSEIHMASLVLLSTSLRSFP